MTETRKARTTAPRRPRAMPKVVPDVIEDDEADIEANGATPPAPKGLPTRQLPAEMKTFEVAFRPPEPLPFAITFTEVDENEEPTGRTERHEFSALSEVGAGGQLAVSALVRYDRQGKTIFDLNALLAFFERVMMSGEYDRLYELVDKRPDLVVPIETLGDVFNWLLEHYTGRPTRPSPSSASARRATGRR